jgi:hypothetical protein
MTLFFDQPFEIIDEAPKPQPGHLTLAQQAAKYIVK